MPPGRLQVIGGAKRPGLRMDAIAELLEPRAQGYARASARWTCLPGRRAGIDAEMARQAGLRGQLMAMPAAICDPGGIRPLPASA